jgi:hypothetical protein
MAAYPERGSWCEIHGFQTGFSCVECDKGQDEAVAAREIPGSTDVDAALKYYAEAKKAGKVK